jgi:hypothetical protein
VYQDLQEQLDMNEILREQLEQAKAETAEKGSVCTQTLGRVRKTLTKPGRASTRSRESPPGKCTGQVHVVRHEPKTIEQHGYPAKTQRSTQRLARKTASRCRRRRKRLSTSATLQIRWTTSLLTCYYRAGDSSCSATQPSFTNRRTACVVPPYCSSCRAPEPGVV